ncbi:replication initiation protein RepM [Escherichia coli]|jgi:plasmid replication initiation protein|uniref:replication initiation protein RepM n=1 Tax=Escherichia coli TaxID=562 RepID=UPI00295DA1B5|nr:replication initiation protein [Citrobacter braakii]
MGDLVVKDNALINASYNLDLVEQRLILLAIIEARQSGKGINANDPLTIHAESYINQFSAHRNTAYEGLKSACKALFSRYFTYQEPRGKAIANIQSRWVSQIAYIDEQAKVEIIFAPAIIPLITRLEKEFTKYDIQQVSGLSSGYAIRLYELLIAWRSTGKTPIIEINEFRKKLGVLDTEYKQMNNFKSRVLEPAITQINEKTDIKIKVEQHKTGRSITGFSFKFKQKQTAISEKTIPTQRDQNTPDLFTKMTDPQRFLFAHKLSEMPEMSKYSEGTESYEDFAKRIADMLLEPEKFKKFYPLLEKLGFGSKKIQPTVKQVDQVKTYNIEDHKFIAFDPRGSVHLSSCAFNIARDKRYKHMKKDSEKMTDFENRLKTMLLDEKQQSQFFEILRGEKSRFELN